MGVYVTVLLSHGVTDRVNAFASEVAAVAHATTLAHQNDYTERTPMREFGAQVWLARWGDEDGCAVGVARTAVGS